MPFRLPPRDPFGIALATWFNAVPHFVFVKTNVRAGGPNLAGSLSIRSGKHAACSHDQVTLLLRLRDDTDLSGGHQYVILRKRATGLYVVPAWREALSRAALQQTYSAGMRGRTAATGADIFLGGGMRRIARDRNSGIACCAAGSKIVLNLFSRSQVLR